MYNLDMVENWIISDPFFQSKWPQMCVSPWSSKTRSSGSRLTVTFQVGISLLNTAPTGYQALAVHFFGSHVTGSPIRAVIPVAAAPKLGHKSA